MPQIDKHSIRVVQPNLLNDKSAILLGQKHDESPTKPSWKCRNKTSCRFATSTENTDSQGCHIRKKCSSKLSSL